MSPLCGFFQAWTSIDKVAAVMVGVPALDMMPTATVVALGKLRLPPGSEIRYEAGLGSIAHKRNQLAEAMLADPRFGALFFCDHDMVPPADTVERLLAHHVGIVGALYFGRIPPYYAQAGFTNPGGWLRPLERFGGRQEVDVCGTGALLIRREVFEAVPRPWFKHPYPDPIVGGEDSYFCKMATGSGIQTYCDTDLAVGHLATVEMNQDLALAWERTATAPAGMNAVPTDATELMRTIASGQKAITPDRIANGR
jgi:hypothetical protein